MCDSSYIDISNWEKDVLILLMFFKQWIYNWYLCYRCTSISQLIEYM